MAMAIAMLAIAMTPGMTWTRIASTLALMALMALMALVALVVALLVALVALLVAVLGRFLRNQRIRIWLMGSCTLQYLSRIQCQQTHLDLYQWTLIVPDGS